MLLAQATTLLFIFLQFATVFSAGGRYLDALNEMSNNNFQKEGPKSFVCLNPHAGIYGGFGNLIMSAIAVQAFSLTMNATSILNHGLILSMFDHPDPRQSWKILSPEYIWKNRNTVRRPPTRCGQITQIDLAQFTRKFGINQCFANYILHPATVSLFSNKLHVTYKEETQYLNEVLSIVAEWSFSKPTKYWSDLMANYRNSTLSACGSGVTKPDLLVQFRTWRDVGSQQVAFEALGGNCHESCSKRMIAAMHEKLSRPVCTYVTSDNHTSSLHMVDMLNRELPQQVVAVTASAVAMKHWHSLDIVQQARRVLNVTSSLHLRTDLKEWMLMGEATHALYTKGSTYALTARLRRGLRGQYGDYVSDSNGAGNGVCRCEQVHPNNDPSEHLILPL